MLGDPAFPCLTSKTLMPTLLADAVACGSWAASLALCIHELAEPTGALEGTPPRGRLFYVRGELCSDKLFGGGQTGGRWDRHVKAHHPPATLLEGGELRDGLAVDGDTGSISAAPPTVTEGWADCHTAVVSPSTATPGWTVVEGGGPVDPDEQAATKAKTTRPARETHLRPGTVIVENYRSWRTAAGRSCSATPASQRTRS